MPPTPFPGVTLFHHPDQVPPAAGQVRVFALFVGRFCRISLLTKPVWSREAPDPIEQQESIRHENHVRVPGEIDRFCPAGPEIDQR